MTPQTQLLNFTHHTKEKDFLTVQIKIKHGR